MIPQCMFLWIQRKEEIPVESEEGAGWMSRAQRPTVIRTDTRKSLQVALRDAYGWKKLALTCCKKHE